MNTVRFTYHLLIRTILRIYRIHTKLAKIAHVSSEGLAWIHEPEDRPKVPEPPLPPIKFRVGFVRMRTTKPDLW